MSFRVPIKGALPGSPGRSPIARDALFPGPSFTYLSNALVNEPPPLHIPPAGPLWRELPISRAFFYISLRVPNEQGLALKIPGKGAPLQIPPSDPSMERDAPFRVFFYISLYPKKTRALF